MALSAALLALLMFGMPLGAAVRQVYLNSEQRELTHLAEQAAAAVSIDSLHGADPVELPSTESDTAVSVYTAGTGRVAGRGPATIDPVVTDALAGRLAERVTQGQILAAVPVRDGERVVGAVRVASSARSVAHRTWLSWSAMLALAALALSAAAFVARRQARRLTQPLTDLAGAAHALGDGDFTVRAGRSGIPEIDTAAAALDHTAARLDDLLARERAFSANASHQLRTPLTGLRLALESALDGDESALRQAAHRAIEAADRLEHTIEDLLAVARSDTATRERLDIDAILDDIHRARIGSLGGQGRALRIERDVELPMITASPVAIRQTLGVLLDNAIEHGGGAVTVRARNVDGALAVDVCDEGPGPDPMRSTDLFDRSRSRAAGRGLGLPLARALAEAEGGRLVLTRAGARPCFTLFLPQHSAGGDSGADGPTEDDPAQ
ncbi:sensor histidine kinase [Micromonospora sp. NPDC093277]|uniref:sensor histidine kinase n=1 Tax=Micromonospora sp. NPDC093277 TaxID=3364291 RepID=UPI0037F6F1F7